MRGTCTDCNLLFIHSFLDSSGLCRSCQAKNKNIDKIIEPTEKQIATLKAKLHRMKGQNISFGRKIAKLQEKLGEAKDQSNLIIELQTEISRLNEIIIAKTLPDMPKLGRFKTNCKDYKKLTPEQRKLYGRIRKRDFRNPHFGGDLISVQDFCDFILNIDFKCCYCPNPATGLDRVDNKITYTKDNIQPCCQTCNRMKWTMTDEEFRDHLKSMKGN